VLQDNKLLHSEEGHITVSWLVVEDIVIIAGLLLLPLLAVNEEGTPFSFTALGLSMLSIVVKFLTLIIVMFTLGTRLVAYLFTKIVKTHSQELFTLSVLALTFTIAVGSSYIFDTSIALGAFIAGLVLGQTEVKSRVSTSASPLKDTFVVIFFLSIGMLFNPYVVVEYFTLFILIVISVLIFKSVAAFVIALSFKHQFYSALVIAVSLAQIGELSFILMKEGSSLNLLPSIAFDLIVAASIVSLAINPFILTLAHKKLFASQKKLSLSHKE
jgi:CPA2 family monovalent cation:H+ antiporter-2